MSSVTTRVAALSEDKRRLLLEKLSAKKQVSRIRPRTEESGSAPLSYAQQRLWFLQQLDPTSTQYNLPAAVRIEGPLDRSALERCFAEIVRRHESLRTTFTTVDGAPVQVAGPAVSFSLPVSDAKDLDEAVRKIDEQAHAPFDLERGALFRAELLRLGDEEHILVLNAHHIISDSWSFGILVREILALYETTARGGNAALPAPSLRYSDFARWQRDAEQERAIESQLGYWKRKFAGNLPVLELPSDRPRSAALSANGAVLRHVIPDELAERVRSLSQSEGATLFMTLLSAFKTLLLRYTNQEDIIVGSPVAGRERTETQDLIGCFVNTVALRTNCAGDPTFAELIGRVRETCLEGYARQEVPFERVVESVQPDRDLTRTPIFQVAFGLRQDPVRQYRLGRTRFEMLETHTGMTKFDLMLEVIESGKRLTAAVEYNSDLFDAGSIDRLLGHYETLLRAATQAPETPISLLKMTTAAELEQIHGWNSTAKEYPLTRCLHEFIHDQAERTPDATAVVFEHEQITYRELDRRSNRLAHWLRGAGVGPDTPVGVAMERSIDLVVSLVSVLKAGGAYVPIDPEHPAERIANMLEDASPAVLLTQRRLVDVLPTCGARIVAVDDMADEIAGYPCDRPNLNTTPENLAYIIFTSGSTGRPKGAVNGHRGIVNRLCWMQDEYRLNATDRVLQKTPFSFDVSVWEFFWPLMTGATLVVARPGGHRDATYLARLIAKEQITTLHFVPSMLQIFLEEPAIAECRDVRRVICSGEALPFELEQRFFARMAAELHNLYGPTEAAVDVTYWACSAKSGLRTVPIGRPIANTQIHLLDSRMNPVPPGIAGELFIGGVNVGLGYLNRPALTAEKFIRDPFSGDPNARLYRTGDLARYLPDGAIDYLGRIDHQVKIRGFRIELGEIEAVLNKHAGVRESVVVAVGDGADKRLAAYVTASAARLLDSEELRKHLNAALPEYMVPAAFVVLESLPLSPNGKVDRKALPAPNLSTAASSTADYVPPRTPTEELLAQVWCSALGVARAGRRDDFFRSGGHSLLAAQLASRVRTTMGVELPVRRIFEQPTLEGLAAAIDRESQGRIEPPITRQERPDGAPLSFSQQRLWILDQLAAGGPVYHLPVALRIQGDLNSAALEKSLAEIVKRHESLRTRFAVRNGSPVQVIEDSIACRIESRDLAECGDECLNAALLDHVREPFNLLTGPLIRAALFRLDAGDHVLALTMHHIISDGWSLTVLLRELGEAYAAYSGGVTPPWTELPVQYADYAMWQREWLDDEVYTSQLDYWRKQLDRVPMLNLPSDRSRPRVQTFKGARRTLSLPPERSEQIGRFARERNATTFMVLFAAYCAVLARYAGQTDITVGTPVANRNRGEIEGVIGFFVNTLVLRARLDGDPAFADVVARVRETCLEAYANQDLPFERLVEELRPERHLGANPLFQVAFTLRDAPNAGIELPGARVSVLDPPEGISKFDLTMEIETSPTGLRVGIEYDSALFDASTIDALARNFATLLNGAIAKPETRLSRLPLVNDEDRRQMLTGCNDTRTAYPRHATVPALFAEIVRKSPHATAVEFEDATWSYAELDQRSNQIARLLRRSGCNPGDFAGLCMQRSAHMVAATLGILKAGCAYVPLDAGYPSGRLRLMLEDTGAPVVVADRELLPKVESLAGNARIVCADDARGEAVNAVEDRLEADNAAYVMYTSGSTGTPKGIAVPHKAIVRLVRNTNYVELDERERIGQVSNISFDAATFELWGALLNGAALVGIRKETALDPVSLASAIREKRISTMFMTTALFNQMAREVPDAFRTMRTLLTGGEAMDASAVRRVLASGPPNRLLNVYGPTESTTFATWYCIGNLDDGAAGVPIGGPISNTTAYVLDHNRELVPLGVPGELFIGGDGLALGYWNRPELNVEKFVPNPFAAGERLYRTGDLVRYRRDGAIEFLGRLDHQVKVRGFRIEPGEIDAALALHSGLKASVTLVREDAPGEKRVVTYCVAADGQAPSGAEVRQFLAQRLPEYMLPGHVMMIDGLPINENGKIDRALLPVPGHQRMDKSDGLVAPRSDLERTLVAIWADVLGVDDIGIEDNFFAIGGHSLMATQVASRIREALGVETPLRLLFEHQTIAELAGHLGATGAMVRQTAQVRPRVDRGAPVPASFSQRRLWFLDQLMPGNALYNVAAMVRLTGDLDVDALETALSMVVNRHESLRTTFRTESSQPVQVAGPENGLPLMRIDLSQVDSDWREKELERLASDEAKRPFDLANGPLVRATLVQTEPAAFALLLTMHHIVCDGWSIGVFIREAGANYESLVRGQQVKLPKLTVQYADYSVWQKEQAQAFEEKLTWWKERLAGALPALELPLDRPRPAQPSFRGTRYRTALPRELSNALRGVAQDNGATLFMTLLSGFKALLARYSGQEDIIVGSPIAGRTSPELETLIGFFVNTLVLRTDVSGDPSFRELLSRVRENTLGAYANQDVPFEMLVDAVAPERSRSRNPLFQAAFVLQNAPASALELPGLKVQVEETDPGTSKFDLTLVMQETEDGISVCFEYSTDLFNESTIRRMAEHLETLLSGIAENPERPISELPLMNDVEQDRVVRGWNQTTAPFPADRCLQDLFLEQVRRTPDAVAVAFDGRQMTYAELNARANQLASALRTIGFGPEWLAAIALPRSAEMIVAILGALKAGGAWMPVAVDQPEDRIAFMLNDACPQVVIGDRNARARLPRAAQRFQALDIDDAAVKNEPDADAPHGAKPCSLAYVIYTSGSTGRPKGVMLEHRGACNLAFAQAKLFGVSAGTRMLQFAAPTFDAAVSEIFVTLLNGGTLVLARREQLVGHDLAELLKGAEVEVVTLPPSILATIPQADLPKLRTLVTAGEACPAELARRWSEGRLMINAYGPTEATVCATAGEMDGDGCVTIGRPIDNVRVYIVDAKLRPVPPGVPGEVLVGGLGVARGYLQRPELTRERFVPDPFADGDGARVYRTGDRARFLEDGRIEYLGRTDRQVKIRGFRIEPGEIEAALLQHGTVREAVVIDREDTPPGHRRLVAYVSRRDGAEIRTAELREALSATLPEYMLPSAIVVVPALPLTAHGKIDRTALPAPEMDGGRGDASHAQPQTETEQQLAEIWKQVLGLSQVGVNDSFFELGGDSILTIQVVTRAREAGLNLSPRDLFDHQTIARLAAAAEKAPAVMWEQSVAPGPVPLTPIQKWFFEQKLADAHHWNQSVLLKLADAPDLAAMERAVNALIAHHDALRLRFEESADGWRQEIVAGADASTVPVFDLSEIDAGTRAACMEDLATGVQASFGGAGSTALAEGLPHIVDAPLMKAALFNLGDGGWRLLLTAHHLSVDGVSWRILLEDLHTAYEQLRHGGTIRLAAKTASVRQWADALMARAKAPETTAESEYWRSVARRDAAHLPVDWSGTPHENTRLSCETAAMRLSPEQTAQLLREVPKAYRSQINDALLTALARAVRTWTGQNSVLVNLESHGRDAVADGPDLSRTVGWFTSAYPVSIELPKSGDLGESLKAVKEQLRRVPRNGSGYGLLRYLAGGEIASELAAAPEPEIGFNYLGQLDGSFAQATAFSMAGESRGQEHSPRGRRTNLLEFNGNVSEGQLHFTCVYSRSVHDRATVEQLLREFAKELGALIAHCAAPDAGGFTPSDFPLARLDERKLGKLARLIAKPAQGKVAATV